MKRLSILSAMLALCCTLSAQIYTESKYYNQSTGHLEYTGSRGSAVPGINAAYVGLRLGVTFGNFSSDIDTYSNTESRTGLNFGIVAGWEIDDPLYFETGLMYIEKGGEHNTAQERLTYDLNYIEVPLVVKYSIDVNEFRIQPHVGGYMALGVGGKMKNYDTRHWESSFSDNSFKHFDGGLRFGCGFAYEHFYAEFAYDLGLANISHSEFEKARTTCLSLNFGINF